MPVTHGIAGTPEFDRMGSAAGWSIDAFGNVRDGYMGSGGGGVAVNGRPRGTAMSIPEFIGNALYNSPHGGHWENGYGYMFGSAQEALSASFAYHKRHEQQRNWNVDKRLKAFVARYFSKEVASFINNKLVIKADYDLKYTTPIQTGATIPLGHRDHVEGTVQIYINAFMLSIDENAKLAYLTVGHELIHGMDQDSGVEFELMAIYGRNSDEMFAIMETHAYEWSLEAAKRLGVDSYIYEMIEKNLEWYRSQIPADFDYDAWFKK